MTEFRLETKYSSVDFNVKKSSNQKPMGAIAHTFITSQNRIKYYYYAVYGEQAISNGEKLYSEFEIRI
ncbi:hypothetical protein [Ruminococcus flavefaciens]|uniref:hypothetical protein n=1 Tax=Ruminococcus flavefaciens TaxID=1265 RepID=UPI0026ED3D5D|nr:hypothetical protein [Ruminococcus flavefaciens]